MSGVYNIPANADFLGTLAAGLLAMAAAEQTPLHQFTIFLPNRRAARQLADALLSVNKDEPLLLPNLWALGDIDGDELLLQGAALDLPPTLSAQARLALLTELIQTHLRQVDGGVMGFAPAWQLAIELCGLLDQIIIEELPLAKLCTLAPAAYAEHWQGITAFLRLLAEAWPEKLAGLGMIEAVTRRRILLEAQAAFWQRHPPRGPVIAAGSTGSVPATARLLQSIAALPRGTVLLPGLDTAMDGESWAAVDCHHPQYYLGRLCAALSLSPEKVPDWPYAPPASSARVALWREIMRPASTTAAWQTARLPTTSAAGIAALECDSEQELAATTALILRETLAMPGQRAALVTPDRILAQQVIAQLRRFGVTADDSAGQSLATTVPGGLIFALLGVVREGGEPASVLNLLAQSMTRLGAERSAVHDLATHLELYWRNSDHPKPECDWKILQAALPEPVHAPLARLATALACWPKDATARPAAAWWQALIASAETIAQSASGENLLWQQPASESLQKLCADWLLAAEHLPPLPAADWAAWAQDLIAQTVWRPPKPAHPRLQILSPIEARMLHADRIVIAGLDEGIWPPGPEADPWLSRPMREEYGLPPRERRVGQSAHDLVQLAAQSAEVFLCRASRRFGEQPLASRFWLRAQTVLSHHGEWENVLARGYKYRQWAGQWNHPSNPVALPPPAPCPPMDARPKRLFVTAIETLQRDPYAFYAKQILRLRPLPELQKSWDGAARGNLVHAIAEDFLTNGTPGKDAAQNLSQLLACAEKGLLPWADDFFVGQLWRPRLAQILRWLAETEASRRLEISHSLIEKIAAMRLVVDGSEYEIAAKPDRIDVFACGRIGIIDYKTGQPPSQKDLNSGLAPQLPLTAAIFAGVANYRPEFLEYWHLHGKEDGAEIIRADSAPMALAEQYLAGLERLLRQYQNPEQSYPSAPWGMRLIPFNDYAHLARNSEWDAQEDAA